MRTGLVYQAERAVTLNNLQPYRRLSDVKSTDNGPVQFKLGTNSAFTGYADNSYGGGWILILQYVHAGNTNPALRSIAAYNNLPVLSSAALGADESGILANWGSIAPAFLLAFPDATADLEFRFFGRTSGHARVIHFITDSGMVSRFRNNTGTMLDVNFQYQLLTGHTANLPRIANNTFNQQSLTEFPMYSNGANHWGIRGQGNRWEVDDFPGNFANSTIHRVWVRYKQGSTFPLINNGDLNQGATGWTLAGNVSASGGRLTYSSGDTPITGVASQVCQTEAGSQYNLRYTVGRNGSCAVATARVNVEVRDTVTNALIASQLSPAAATYNLSFTARGTTTVRFVDQTVNTTGCDVTVDNISLSRYVQG